MPDEEIENPVQEFRHPSEESNPTIVEKHGSKSLAPGAFIILIILVFVSAISVLQYTKASNDIEIIGPAGLTITVEISSPIFKDAYTTSASPDYCNDPKEFPEISTATLYASDAQGASLGSVKLGNAIGYNALNCQFRAFLPLNNELKSGQISIYVKFRFGESESFAIDVGKQPPYKIDLKLNLG